MSGIQESRVMLAPMAAYQEAKVHKIPNHHMGGHRGSLRSQLLKHHIHKEQSESKSPQPVLWEESYRTVFVAQSSPLSKKKKQKVDEDVPLTEGEKGDEGGMEREGEKSVEGGEGWPGKSKGRVFTSEVWGSRLVGAVQQIKAERGKYHELDTYKNKHREIRKIREELEATIKKMHVESCLESIGPPVQNTSQPDIPIFTSQTSEKTRTKKKASIHNERIKLFARGSQHLANLSLKKARVSDSKLEPQEARTLADRTHTKNTTLMDDSDTERRDISLMSTERLPQIKVFNNRGELMGQQQLAVRPVEPQGAVTRSGSLPIHAQSDRAIRRPFEQMSKLEHHNSNKDENKYLPRKSLRGSFRVSFRSNLPGESLALPTSKSPLRLLTKEPPNSDPRRSLDIGARPSRIGLFIPQALREHSQASSGSTNVAAVQVPSRFRKAAMEAAQAHSKQNSEGPSAHSEVPQRWGHHKKLVSFKPFGFVDDALARVEKVQERLWVDPPPKPQTVNTIPSIILPRQDEALLEEGTMQMSKIIQDSVAKSYEKIRKRSTHYTDRIDTADVFPHILKARSRSQQSIEAVDSLIAKTEGIMQACEKVCQNSYKRVPMRELVQMRYQAIDSMLRGSHKSSQVHTTNSLNTSSLPEQHKFNWESRSRLGDTEGVTSEHGTRRVLLESSDMIIEGRAPIPARRTIKSISGASQDGGPSLPMSKHKQETVLFLKNVREGNARLEKEGFLLL